MKFLHVTEVKDVILSQMEQTIVPTASPAMPQPQKPNVFNGLDVPEFDRFGHYLVKPLFWNVLRQVPEVNPTQMVFSYREVSMTTPSEEK